MFLQIFSLQSPSLSPSFRLTQHSLNTASCFSTALSQIWNIQESIFHMLFHFSWRTEHQRVHMHSQWVSSPVPTALFHCYHSPPSPFDHSRNSLFQHVLLGFLSRHGVGAGKLKFDGAVSFYSLSHSAMQRFIYRQYDIFPGQIPRIYWICKEDIIWVGKPLQTEMSRKAICWVFGGWRG